ncbi:MAG: hypothetical protein A3I08_02750 [Candidatus Andersenbacteria bacterium RIFCSPLOWO2_02_FULL_46_11]|nr:MAG: putative beta-1,3-galactosyltransferase [Parcubacteria group bacterium GW2011_GWA2_45_14]OGY33272.1 MAG: hypothetical protein A3B76_01100 [Candidatus Andersenbacteria bacterium RIFCSPHIGHO2_02_FULL_46_16]OGY38443.1 MAG: hypothetical protein A3I08_02750 [Candidatus Andersenbacteria bacterium RIFCSPLOWO2_02_FULL_46_11]
MTPLVSIIVPTRNSAVVLQACLNSIKQQTYKNIELVIVDNNSTDNTLVIAKSFTNQVFSKGPERSAQRNLGARQAHGDYLLFIDSDMKLSPQVVASCVEKIQNNPQTKAIIIPEESFGEGFWAQCKKLERSFYIGVDWMEAARFFTRDAFEEASGFDENMISGEDWDLSQRVGKKYPIDSIDQFIYHNEGKVSLRQIIKKKFYYARNLTQYQSVPANKIKLKYQASIKKRYLLFLSDRKKLFSTPLTSAGMLFMKSCEFGFGGVGYLFGKIKAKRRQ